MDVNWHGAWPILALGGIWVASETTLGLATFRRGERKGSDRGSLALMVGLSTLSAVAALTLWYVGIGRLPSAHGAASTAGGTFAIVGGLIALAGIALRWWAILALRGQFTINVAVLADHRLVTSGPYSRVRHPSYAGTLLTLLGLGVGLGNPAAAAALVAGPLIALLNRIRIEEPMLRELFGADYDAYCARTSRLVPGLF
jgi:protein-S-isoprenylcysteine O-methyltransferase